MKILKAAAVAAAAGALALVPLGGASAAPTLNPAKPKAANPSQSCAFVAAYVKAITGSAPAGWSHSGCVKTVASSVPVVEEGDPNLQCAAMEAEGLTYPFAFYEGAPPGQGFPGLIAHDRTQCARALWAFHTLVTYLGPPPGPQT